MKPLLIVALFPWLAVAAVENSILYPRQIQPKVKRPAGEEVLERQRSIEETQREILDEQRRARQDASQRADNEMLMRAFDELTGR